MKKILPFVFGFILTGLFADLNAQAPSVYGWIRDKESGEAIHGAVVVDSASMFYTYTNQQGYFYLGLPSGRHILQVSAGGYVAAKLKIDVYQSVPQSFWLNPLDEEEPDTVSNEYHTIYDYRSGHTAPSASQINDMPTLLSEPDPVKFAQYLPGVTGGIEGLAGLYVRGGNADQNLITMDGLPLYGNGHLAGLFSQYNVDLIRDMQFYRGAAPARYGGRAGAVMDVNMKEGNDQFWKGNFWSDLLTLRLSADGPIDKAGKTTASFGIRRSWLDLLLPKSGDNFVYYTLHDINAKVVYRPNVGHQWSFWVYNGRDKFDSKFAASETDTLNRTTNLKLQVGVAWQNTLAGVSYSQKINNRLYANYTVGLSRYAFENFFSFEGELFTDTSYSQAKISVRDKNSLTDLIGRADFEFGLNADNHFRFGAEAIRHGFKPREQTLVITSNNVSDYDSTIGKVNTKGTAEASVYGEWIANLSVGLKLNAGIRLWQFYTSEKSYIRPEPRIMLSQILQGKKALKLSFSMANQGLHQLSSVNGNLPGDVWFPVGSGIVPQQNIQIAGGFYQPWKHGIEFSIDLFYKRMKGITDITGGDEGDLELNFWENMIAQGTGTSNGIELLSMKKHGRFKFTASYTLSKSVRKFEEINFGREFPFRWDRRHKFGFQGIYRVNENFMLNLGVVLMSGNAVSVPTGRYLTADGKFVFDYSEKNNYRMPFYRRVDLGFKKQISQGRSYGAAQYWGMNIYNLASWQNPLFVRMDKNDQNVMSAFGISYFPIVPSIFYQLTF